MNRKQGIAAGKAIVVILAVMALWRPMGVSAADGKEPAPGRVMARQATIGQEPWTTTDHSKHVALQKEFGNGNEITAACLSCHS